MDIRVEKRLAPRRNTMLAAEIMFHGGQKQGCIIRNVSDNGAKLEFANVGRVPGIFDLIAPGHRPQHCRVIWRAIRELGVEFGE